MWLGLNQESEYINTDELGGFGIFVGISVERAAAREAVPLDHYGRAISLPELPWVSVHLPLVFSPATLREPTTADLQQIVDTTFEGSLPGSSWRLDSYYVVLNDLLPAREDPWQSWDDGEWRVVCQAPEAMIARRILRHILNSIETESIDNIIVDAFLGRRQLGSNTRVEVPWYYGYLIPRLSLAQPHVTFVVADESRTGSTQPVESQLVVPSRQITLDGPAVLRNADPDELPVPPTRVERALLAISVVREYYGMSTDVHVNAAEMMERFLNDRAYYGSVVIGHLQNLRDRARAAGEQLLFDEFLDYISQNNNWSPDRVD